MFQEAGPRFDDRSLDALAANAQQNHPDAFGKPPPTSARSSRPYRTASYAKTRCPSWRLRWRHTY